MLLKVQHPLFLKIKDFKKNILKTIYDSLLKETTLFFIVNFTVKFLK